MGALNGAKTSSTANSFLAAESLAAHVRNPLLPLENSGLALRDVLNADVRAETLNNTASSQISTHVDAGTLNNPGIGHIYGDHVVTNGARGGAGVISQDLGVTIKTISNGGDNLLSTSVKTGAGDVNILAEVKVNGSQLHLDSFTVYGANGDVAKGSILKDVLSAKSDIIQAAKENGFKEIRITAERVPNSTSANPGKQIDLIIPVK